MTFKEWWVEKWRGASRLTIAREAWEAGQENLPVYEKYEFCKQVECIWLEGGKCFVDNNSCVHSAKAFHHWLRENGYRIVKT